MEQTRIVVLAGATGDLGHRVARELIYKNAQVKALVRHHSSDEAVTKLRELGVTIIVVDYDDAAELAGACEGASCVVSCLAGMRDVIIDTQRKLLDAAVKAGVKRFIPSDFSMEYMRLPRGQNRNLEWRREIQEQSLDHADIRVTSILNGPFTEILTDKAPLVFPRLGRVVYWGDSPDVVMNFTTMDNVAQYTAAVVLDDDSPRFLRIAGDSLCARQIASAASPVKDRPLALTRAGSLGTLRWMTSITRAVSSDSTLYPPWVGMQYFQGMFSGDGSLEDLDNDRYPHMQWTSVADVFAARFASLL